MLYVMFAMILGERKWRKGLLCDLFNFHLP